MHELMFYFNVDFVLTKGDLFQNETEKLSENSEYKKGLLKANCYPLVSIKLENLL